MSFSPRKLIQSSAEYVKYRIRFLSRDVKWRKMLIFVLEKSVELNTVLHLMSKSMVTSIVHFLISQHLWIISYLKCSKMRLGKRKRRISFFYIFSLFDVEQQLNIIDIRILVCRVSAWRLLLMKMNLSYGRKRLSWKEISYRSIFFLE